MNNPEFVGAPLGDLLDVGEKIPVADNVRRGEVLGCVVGVNPSEGVAKVVRLAVCVAEANTVGLTRGLPVTEYDEVGERIPEDDSVCELDGLCSVELLASIVLVPCVTVNKELIEAREVRLTKGEFVTKDVLEGLPWPDTVTVNNPEID